MTLPTSTAAAPHESVERILDAATRLFAEHGFHGVSTRQLSAATGLNVATIHHHLGSKRDLYLRVIDRLFEQEERLIGPLLDRIDEAALADRAALLSLLSELIAGIVTLARTHPDRQRLYARRWLEAPDELRAREAELSLNLYRKLADQIAAGQRTGVIRADLDVENFLRSFDWMVIGYFTSGAFDWKTLRADPFDDARVTRFTRYLHDYAARMLGLMEETSQ